MPKETKREIITPYGAIDYTLIRKRVKNVNLRIKDDLSLQVSACSSVPVSVIDGFVLQKAKWIFEAKKRTLSRTEREAVGCTRTESECMEVFEKISNRIYPAFSSVLSEKPVIKAKLMKSRWGVCYPGKKCIILNIRLLDKPYAAIEYVVLHEYVHFIHPNHQAGFHELMKKLMPDYNERKKLLK